MSAREEIREWENQCNECKKRKGKAGSQVMGPLPKVRLRFSMRAFAQTAVDYGGPFITIQGRGKARLKRWLCLFTCLASRAIHCEMAFGLDTDSFLNAFARMAYRRGLPQEVVSDRGTNFIGANRELKELVEKLDKDKICQKTANRGVTWIFNPPQAPHFGGAHEIMIKAAKKAIHAVLGEANVTDEELMTAFIGAESLLNSRPITYQTANPCDQTPLTPNHFLYGQVGGTFAPDSVDETEFQPKKRWRRVQELISHFWRRWLKEWLPSQNVRSRWNEEKRDLKVGDVVLAISSDLPRAHWPLGRITEIYQGKDNHVRVAKVQVGQNSLLRPVNKLIHLDVV